MVGNPAGSPGPPTTPVGRHRRRSLAVAAPMRQAGDMSPTLPFPLRVAVGLVARGVETARRIPNDLPGLGVEIAGNAAKVAMVVRNELTDLAVRGDELLAGRIEPEDDPSWATFDDDDPAPEVAGTDVDSGLSGGGLSGRPDPARSGGGRSVRGRSGTANPAATQTPEDADSPDPATGTGTGTDGDSPVHPLTEDELAADTAATSSEHLAAAEAVLPGWKMLTVAQLRGHLGHLSVADVRLLLRNEEDGASRPAYVTLLANRISTLEHSTAGGSR